MTGARPGPVPPPLGPAGEIAARFIARGRAAVDAARPFTTGLPVGGGDIFTPRFGGPLIPPNIMAGGVMQFPGNWAAIRGLPTRTAPITRFNSGNLEADQRNDRLVAEVMRQQGMAYLCGTPFEQQSQAILQQGLLMQQQVMMQQMLCNQMYMSPFMRQFGSPFGMHGGFMPRSFGFA